MLLVWAIIAVASGCYSSQLSLEPAKAEPTLTPESARAALVELVRNDPKTFEVKVDPDDLLATQLEDTGTGKYKLGWIGIDIQGHTYSGTLSPANPDAACTIDYAGAFTFENGHWIARKPVASYLTPAR